MNLLLNFIFIQQKKSSLKATVEAMNGMANYFWQQHNERVRERDVDKEK